jgi:glutaredoxin-related protein
MNKSKNPALGISLFPSLPTSLFSMCVTLQARNVLASIIIRAGIHNYTQWNTLSVTRQTSHGTKCTVIIELQLAQVLLDLYADTVDCEMNQLWHSHGSTPSAP